MKQIKIKCPCCEKYIQIILSSNIDTGDVKVASVFLNEEINDLYITKNNQEELANELFEKQNILLG